MRVLLATAAAVLLAANTAAAAPCCHEDKGCEKAAVCCKHQPADAIGSDLAQIPPGFDWREGSAEKPTREYAKVFFRDPVKVGSFYLMGAYVIEHDAERMARGLPCTHIYAADDLRLPVVTFHCRHLTRSSTPKATVTLRRLPDYTTRMFTLVEYQFEGSADGHGVPDGR